MENIVTPPSYGIPKIDFNSNTGVLLIEGRSIPEHPKALYLPLIDWVNEYTKSPATLTEVIIRVDYLNSSSYKFLITLLEQLKSIKDSTVIKWHYEIDDDEMSDVGVELQDILDVPVEIIGEEEFE